MRILFRFVLPVLMLGMSAWYARGDDFVPPESAILPEARMAPEHPTRAQWLWGSRTEPKGYCYFRYAFDLPGAPAGAWCYVSFDDSGDFYVNGHSARKVALDRAKIGIPLNKYEFAELLKPGRNVIAMRVHNDAGPGGPIVRGEVVDAAGHKTILVSEPDTCKASMKEIAGWPRPDFDDAQWAKAISLGDATAKPWHSISRVYEVFALPEELAATEANRDKMINPPDLSKEAPSVARIVWRGDRAALDINGRIEPPFFYLTLDGIWQETAADAILKSYRSGVRIFSDMVPVEKYYAGDGKYDFTPLDPYMKRLLTLCPEAKIVLNLRFNIMPPEWMRAHPDELVGYAAGPAQSGVNQMKRFLGPSNASEPFRREFAAQMRNFTKFIATRDWGRRVIAMRVSYGVYGEWHYYGTDGEAPDTSPAMTRYFRQYLTEKYQTDAALAAAWHRPEVTLATAQVPDCKIREGRGLFLRDPASEERQAIDYFRCHQQALSDLLLIGARAVKEVNPNLLVGAYYGYCFCMSYPPEGQTLMLERVLSSPDIDFLSAPYGYTPPTRLANGDGLLRSLPLLFRKYGKLAVSELDVRTCMATERFYRIATEEQSVAVLERDIANVWLAGCGLQLLDLEAPKGLPSWWNSPQIQTVFHRALQAWKGLLTQEIKGSGNRAAVVWNVPEMIVHGHAKRDDNYPLARALSDSSLHALNRSGCSYDLLSLEQYLESGDRYSMAIFLNLFSPTPEQRAKLIAMTRRPQMTAVYVYAPGAVTADGISAAAASELTGIQLKMDMKPGSFLVHYKNGLSSGELYEKKKDAPRLSVQDAKAEILGRWADNDEAAEAVKRLAGGGTAVFAGSPLVDPVSWNELFQLAKIHVYTRPGIVMHAAGNLLLVLTDKAADIPVRLPGKVRRVKDLFTGRILARNTARFTLKSNGICTWALELEQ